MKKSIVADATRGFDVMVGATVIASFGTKAEAWAYARTRKGAYIRYWAAKGE